MSYGWLPRCWTQRQDNGEVGRTVKLLYIKKEGGKDLKGVIWKKKERNESLKIRKSVKKRKEKREREKGCVILVGLFLVLGVSFFFLSFFDPFRYFGKFGGVVMSSDE